MIVSFSNQKGGVGKSTLAANTAVCFAMQGAKVALVDADPQGSLMAWLEWRDAGENKTLFPTLSIANSAIAKQLDAMSTDYDLIVVDCPGSLNVALEKITRAALLASDLTVIPVTASLQDVHAAIRLLETRDEVAEYAPETPKCAFLMNRINPQKLLSREIRDTLVANEFGAAVFDAEIRDNEALPKSFAAGIGVVEMNKRFRGYCSKQKGRALNDLNAFCNEVIVMGNE